MRGSAWVGWEMRRGGYLVHLVVELGVVLVNLDLFGVYKVPVGSEISKGCNVIGTEESTNREPR